MYHLKKKPMNLKIILPDLIFILVITAVLLILSETDHLKIVAKDPALMVLGAYLIGRLAGELSIRSRQPG